MEFISFLLIAFIVPLVIGWFSSHEQREKPGGKGKVHQTLPILIIGIIGTAFFWIAAAAAYFLGGEAGPALGFIAISSLGLFLIVAYINCRTEFDDDGFTVKGFWGIKRRYTYADVTHIKETSRGTYIYMGKRWVSFGIFDAGWYEFINTAKRKYKKIYGEPIPKRPVSKFDVYKGNVENGMLVFVIFCAMEVLLLVLGAGITSSAFYPDLENRSQYTETQADRFRIALGGDMVFYGADGSKYKIEGHIAKYVEEERVSAVCNGENVLNIYSKWQDPGDEEEYRSVYFLSCGGEDILTFDVSNKAKTENAVDVIIFISIFNLIWIAFMAVSVVVGRNPKKHPKLFAGIFGQHAKGE